MSYPEVVLQVLLENHPELLGLIDSETNHRHRWLFLKREVSIPDSENPDGRWYLDHLFLDHKGIPTFVEVKVSNNDQIRREVFGQLLDYAANAQKYWPPQKIKQIYLEYIKESENNPIEFLLDFLNENDSTAFNRYWAKVKHNLEVGCIRLVILADEIPVEYLDIIEYLNNQMELSEIWAIQIADYIRENPTLMDELSTIEAKLINNTKVKPNFDTLYQIAESQAGYFTSAQVEEAGYTYERLSDLTTRGQFIRVQRGIYRLVHYPASRFEDLHIASLRTGPDSVVSHESALAVYELSDIIPTKTHIIIPRTGSRRREGIQLHTNKLDDDEITRREGLRITTVERTISDVIIGGISYQHTRQAIQEALQRGLTTESKLFQQAERRKGRAAKVIFQIIGEQSL
jgi:predicted transcriptional regulator of viral defense system